MKHVLLSLYFHFFGFLARYFLKKHKPVVIGVTGSIGKTSCRMLISEILVQSFPHKVISTSSKNFNGELGMSLSILGISDYTPTPLGVLKTIGKAITRAFFVQKMYDVIFLEYGIDHVGEMEFMLSIAQPEIGIVTKIDAVHSSQFQNTDVTAFEKYKLLQETSARAYLNQDDLYAKTFQDSIIAKKRFYTTSSFTSGVDVGGKDFTLFVKDSLPYSRFVFWSDGVSRFEVVSNSLGQENMGYISIGYDIVEYLGNKFYGNSFLQQISSSQELHFALQSSRFSLFAGVGGSVLVDSTYNASPKSMDVVIENTLQLHQKLYPDFELLFVLGEMRELGDYAQSAHEQLAEKIASMTQQVWCVGKDMERYFLPVFMAHHTQAKFYKNSFALGHELAQFLSTSQKKYLVLFKGSQNTIFLEEAVKACLYHPEDAKKLCRQESFWMEKKHNFFCE